MPKICSLDTLLGTPNQPVTRQQLKHDQDDLLKVI